MKTAIVIVGLLLMGAVQVQAGRHKEEIFPQTGRILSIEYPQVPDHSTVTFGDGSKTTCQDDGPDAKYCHQGNVQVINVKIMVELEGGTTGTVYWFSSKTWRSLVALEDPTGGVLGALKVGDSFKYRLKKNWVETIIYVPKTRKNPDGSTDVDKELYEFYITPEVEAPKKGEWKTAN